MTATTAPILREGHYRNAMDVLEALGAVARLARLDGWEVNLALETGGDVDRMTFAAQRPSPLPENEQ